MMAITISERKYNNIRINVDGFTPDIVADSHWIDYHLRNKDKCLVDFISENLRSFLTFVKSMDTGRKAYYPFGLFDQSTSFIVLKKLNELKYNLYFLFSSKLTFGDISPVFSPDLEVPDDEHAIIIGGQIINAVDLDFQIIEKS